MIPASRHLVSTTPRRTTCTPCGRVILEGIDVGMLYRADAVPLNVHGELAARQASRNTYRLLAGKLVLRDAWNIAADTQRGRPPVCATHACEPVNPAHVDANRIPLFLELTAEPEPVAPGLTVEQDALFVLTGTFAGARVIAIPADDPPPF